MPSTPKATLTGTINNGTSPYAIVVRKEGEFTGNRCSNNCTNLPLSFNVDQGSNRYYAVITDSNGCVFTTPNSALLECNNIVPSFNHELIQPTCDINNAIQPAQVIITNLLNSSSYKVCSGAVFNCFDGCTTPTGLITNSSITINLPVTVPNQINNYVLRVYNSCDTFRDINISIFGVNCLSNNTAYYNIDFMLFQQYNFSQGETICEQPISYSLTRDFYIEDITIGSNTFGQTATTSTNPQFKNVPNGNNVPNVNFAAPLKPSCGTPANANQLVTSLFYRFVFNLSQIVASNPSINVFNYDVYTRLTKQKSDIKFPKTIRIVENRFSKVAMKYGLTSNNSTDAIRVPPYNGVSTTKNPDITMLTQTVGEAYRKIGTITFNRSTGIIAFNE